jgi:hypothetical protein
LKFAPQIQSDAKKIRKAARTYHKWKKRQIENMIDMMHCWYLKLINFKADEQDGKFFTIFMNKKAGGKLNRKATFEKASDYDGIVITVGAFRAGRMVYMLRYIDKMQDPSDRSIQLKMDWSIPLASKRLIQSAYVYFKAQNAWQGAADKFDYPGKLDGEPKLGYEAAMRMLDETPLWKKINGTRAYSGELARRIPKRGKSGGQGSKSIGLDIMSEEIKFDQASDSDEDPEF